MLVSADLASTKLPPPPPVMIKEVSGKTFFRSNLTQKTFDEVLNDILLSRCLLAKVYQFICRHIVSYCPLVFTSILKLCVSSMQAEVYPSYIREICLN